MGRLTKRIMDEVILNETGSVICKELCDSMNEYDHPCDMCPINEAIKKLAHYEDVEEQGRLIELPCDLNTKVYYIGQDYKGINEVHSMQFFTYDSCIRHGKGIGEWLYLTKEEAEAKLKELEDD